MGVQAKDAPRLVRPMPRGPTELRGGSDRGGTLEPSVAARANEAYALLVSGSGAAWDRLVVDMCSGVVTADQIVAAVGGPDPGVTGDAAVRLLASARCRDDFCAVARALCTGGCAKDAGRGLLLGLLAWSSLGTSDDWSVSLGPVSVGRGDPALSGVFQVVATEILSAMASGSDAEPGVDPLVAFGAGARLPFSSSLVTSLLEEKKCTVSTLSVLEGLIARGRDPAFLRFIDECSVAPNPMIREFATEVRLAWGEESEARLLDIVRDHSVAVVGRAIALVVLLGREPVLRPNRFESVVTTAMKSFISELPRPMGASGPTVGAELLRVGYLRRLVDCVARRYKLGSEVQRIEIARILWSAAIADGVEVEPSARDQLTSFVHDGAWFPEILAGDWMDSASSSVLMSFARLSSSFTTSTKVLDWQRRRLLDVAAQRGNDRSVLEAIEWWYTAPTDGR